MFTASPYIQSNDFPTISLVSICIISVAMLVTDIEEPDTDNENSNRRKSMDKAVSLLSGT